MTMHLHTTHWLSRNRSVRSNAFWLSASVILLTVMMTSITFDRPAIGEAFSDLPNGKCLTNIPSGWSDLGPPSTRAGAGMAYDAADGYVVVFGGYGDIGTTLDGHTWSYANGCWKQLSPTTSPSPRVAMQMVWDPNSADCTSVFSSDTQGCVLLYGGCTALARAGMYAGGGVDCGTVASDTWEFYNGQWAQVTTTASPGGRFESGMAYDASSGDNFMILYGGCTTKSPCTVGADTWKFVGGATPTWTEICGITACLPGQLYLPAMAYDASSGDAYVLMYGGESGSTAVNSYWKFQSGLWTVLCSSACTPGPRESALEQWDPTYGGILLVGGYNSATPAYLSSTYEWKSGAWTLLCASCGFAPRAFGMMSFDIADDYMLLFGGEGTYSPVLGDIWYYA